MICKYLKPIEHKLLLQSITALTKDKHTVEVIPSTVYYTTLNPTISFNQSKINQKIADTYHKVMLSQISVMTYNNFVKHNFSHQKIYFKHQLKQQQSKLGIDITMVL